MTTETDPRTTGPTEYNLLLRVPPDPQYARSVRSAIESFAQFHHVDSFDVEPLLCAVGEAIANAIEHASSHEDLEVEATIERNQITATVIDHGRGLPAIPMEPTPLPRMLTERGRGIAIMQRCTDIFEVQSEPGNGTRVRLGRFRTRSEKITSPVR